MQLRIFFVNAFFFVTYLVEYVDYLHIGGDNTIIGGGAFQYSCDTAGCDGTRLGHDLAADFPAETAAVDAALARLRGPREDRVLPENLAGEVG